MKHRRAVFFAGLLGLGIAVGVAVSLRQSGAGSPAPIIIAVVIFVAALSAFFVGLSIAAGKRSREEGLTAQRFAQQRGWSYTKKADKPTRKNLSLPRGLTKAGEVRHLIRGELDGRPLTIYEHRYYMHTGNATIPILHTVYASEAPDWPEVHVIPQTGIGRFFNRFGFRKSLELDRAAFNRAFRVATTDDAFAVTLLSPEMQDLMLEKTRGVMWRIGAGQACLVYKGRLRPERMDASLERIHRFWQCVPPELEAWSARIA